MISEARWWQRGYADPRAQCCRAAAVATARGTQRRRRRRATAIQPGPWILGDVPRDAAAAGAAGEGGAGAIPGIPGDRKIFSARPAIFLRAAAAPPPPGGRGLGRWSTGILGFPENMP